MKVFYAHCSAIYGTPQEERDLELLEKLGFTVINPNTEDNQNGYKKFGMEYSHELLKQSDLLVFRALPNGTIPAGIAQEIEWTTTPIIELPSFADRKILNVEQTRTWLKECGQR